MSKLKWHKVLKDKNELPEDLIFVLEKIHVLKGPELVEFMCNEGLIL
jgi:hypothetical protein